MVLLLAGLTPALADCTDADHNRWLEACTSAISAAKRSHAPVNSPWEILESTNPVLEAPPEGSLAEVVVSLCSDPSPVETPCTADQHLSWLRACEQDARRLQSKTRAELHDGFVQQGGISHREERSYVHRRCTNLQVAVRFEAIGPATDFGESPDDLIRSAIPCLGFPLTD